MTWQGYSGRHGGPPMRLISRLQFTQTPRRARSGEELGMNFSPSQSGQITMEPSSMDPAEYLGMKPREWQPGHGDPWAVALISPHTSHPCA